MKKFYLLIAVVATLGMFACDKDESSKDKPLDATVTLTTQLPSTLTFGEPVSVEGTIVTKAAVTQYVLTGVKQEGETYVAVGDAQSYEPSTGTFALMYFPDNNAITSIELTVVAGDKKKAFYFPVTSVTGSAKGDVYVNKTATFYADSIVRNHENSPELYPVENTGAGSSTKSFFSMHGTTVNGVKEHIISLDELRAVDGKNASFAFVNVLQNTANNAFIGGQRGYMFSGVRKASLGGGTTGRQCDIYEVEGHAIADANIDYDFGMTVINGSWIGESYNEPVYKFVDSLFLAIPATVSNKADGLKVYWQLSKIQEKLDNATLGQTEEPTSLANKTYLRRYANGGSGTKSAITENFRAGDYVIIRSKRGTAEEPLYYYGIMQVSFLYDDSGAFADFGEYGVKLDPVLALKLFKQPMIVNIKSQCEL